MDAADTNKVTQALLQSCECPVCLEVAIPPLVQCIKGHFVCSQCRPKIKTCGICRGRYTQARNFAVEDIVTGIQLKCSNSSSGCTEMSKIYEVEHHKKMCTFRPVTCAKCKELFNFKDYTKHLKDAHGYNHVCLTINKFSNVRYKMRKGVDANSRGDCIYGPRPLLLLEQPNQQGTFFLNFRLKDSNAFFWITALVSAQAGDFIADLKITEHEDIVAEKKMNFKMEYSFTVGISPLHTTYEAVEYSKYCASLPIRSLLELSSQKKSDPNNACHFSVDVALRYPPIMKK